MTCIAPMPALEMKRRSSIKSVKGNHLHPCCKYNKASKCVRSQVKTSQQTAVTDNSLQCPNNACPNIAISGEDVESNKAKNFPDKLSEASIQSRKLPSFSSPDHISSARKGSLSVTCTSDLETIFSPNFEHEDVQFKMINHTDAASDEQIELPLLVPDDSDDGSCTPSDFPSYSELDFYNFEDLCTSQFDGDMGFTSIMDTTCSDFECMNPDIMIDMTDRYMILPFLDKKVETSIQNKDSVDGAMMNSDDACLYLAIHQMRPDQDNNVSSHFGDLDDMECVDQQSVFKNLPDLSEAVSSICPIWIQKETRERKPITLVLDLDETLVHSTLEHCDDADFSFPVFFNLKEHTVYVRRRPYLQMFLERVAQMFEIVVFTASQSIYAEQLLDILDPGKNLISHRIYRESCIFSDGNYTKDLTILGVDLAKVAIIDNSPQVFRLQQNNGIPIKSWFDDPADSMLITLLPFLETLVDADDVRPIIAKKFGSEA